MKKIKLSIYGKMINNNFNIYNDKIFNFNIYLKFFSKLLKFIIQNNLWCIILHFNKRKLERILEFRKSVSKAIC